MEQAPLRLSVLDQTPVGEGRTAAEALRASAHLAQAVDGLGYTRYWVAEHHDSPGFAGTAPEILAGHLLARTRHLRIGTGGVLLPRYRAAKVAEVFNVLAALHPGRVDLGVGRAGGPADRFPAQVEELRLRLGLIPGRRPETDQSAPVPPRLWLLGAGTDSARHAGQLGASFAYAYFLTHKPGRAVMDAYRGALNAAGHPPQRGVVAVRVVSADTEARAEELAQSVLLWRSRKDLGQDLPLPSPRSVRGHRWSEPQAQRAAALRATLVAGTPEQVRVRLTRLAAEHGVGEVLVNTLTADPADRVRSYQLLAEAFELKAPAPDTVPV
ncbi:MsnO8 family LLM class oxidoreductase [Streptomyces spectabilis]|uniref:MsnO8 family LLM class oxidoreductase n=1 Tax=Streptomyces spectabilis TaxID=68270 RepID=A0A516RK09_STRST|nr:MsnO8 family LLM class oxidoreductase [Streptomyces spectabilis]QDQ16002.1 MsnO8 family LLM class oxidoreductase [Streptomyces spectabilis]